MPTRTPAEKILARTKGLHKQLQTGEQPQMSIPAIWDGGQQAHSTACDIIITNQRLLGYYLVSWPRERLFLDDLALADITTVSLRQKKFEPVFRELLVSTSERNVYIRAPRAKIETLYNALRCSIESHVPSASPSFTSDEAAQPAPTTDEPSAATFEHQEVSRPFETSPLAITLLLMGGLLVEIIGLLLWINTRSSAIGLPLLIAGIVAVVVATMLRRRLNN
ncbi:MAG: hypothetical protein J2P36_04435 [Ktedonobacteraceae bacterium]|nr:hypothetical protein [Ktedonobacteraceae bacterium]